MTTRCSCEYLAQLSAFDTIVIRMRLREITQNRLTMAFEYWRVDGRDGHEELAARGEQQIACMNREGNRLSPAPIPAPLAEALRSYAAPASAS